VGLGSEAAGGGGLIADFEFRIADLKEIEHGGHGFDGLGLIKPKKISSNPFDPFNPRSI
jgi:hypothetical protein